MLRHVVMFRWRRGTTRRQVDDFMKGLRGLLSESRQVRDFRFGTNVGPELDNYHFVLAADFDDLAGYQAYEADPEHAAFVDRFARPIVGERTAVQHELR